jgi:hypothetical protein
MLRKSKIKKFEKFFAGGAFGIVEKPTMSRNRV